MKTDEQVASQIQHMSNQAAFFEGRAETLDENAAGLDNERWRGVLEDRASLFRAVARDYRGQVEFLRTLDTRHTSEKTIRLRSKADRLRKDAKLRRQVAKASSDEDALSLRQMAVDQESHAHDLEHLADYIEDIQ